MSELSNLIPISYDNPERPTVSGRELHDFLNIETPYVKWFNRMTEYGFTEGEDYAEVLDKIVQKPKEGGRPATDHHHHPNGQRAVHDPAQRTWQAGPAIFSGH